MSRNIFTLVMAGVTFCTACNSHSQQTSKPQAPRNLPLAEAKNEVRINNSDNKVRKETAPSRVPLTVIVENLSSPSAPVEMGVYGPHNKFLDTHDQIKKYRFKPKNGKLVARISDLNYGEFAISLYQDINSDGKIDKDIIGIPEEPYAFSNNYKPVMKAPSFNDCKFNYSSTTNTVTVALLK